MGNTVKLRTRRAKLGEFRDHSGHPVRAHFCPRAGVLIFRPYRRHMTFTLSLADALAAASGQKLLKL